MEEYITGWPPRSEGKQSTLHVLVSTPFNRDFSERLSLRYLGVHITTPTLLRSNQELFVSDVHRLEAHGLRDLDVQDACRVQGQQQADQDPSQPDNPEPRLLCPGPCQLKVWDKRLGDQCGLYRKGTALPRPYLRSAARASSPSSSNRAARCELLRILRAPWIQCSGLRGGRPPRRRESHHPGAPGKRPKLPCPPSEAGHACWACCVRARAQQARP
eukprot:scaffold731_cov261-Pinguiococcus_pyrenoidosus.AAC.32